MRDVDALQRQGASVPTGAALNWRVVYPGEWSCDYAGYIWSDSLKGGRAHLADVRGWGYLTGRGIGALDLPGDIAGRIQDEVGALIAAAPDLLEALQYAVNTIEAMRPAFSQVKDEGHAFHDQVLDTARAAIAKATADTAALDDRADGYAEGMNPK